MSQQHRILLTLSIRAITECRAIIWYPGFKGTTAKHRA